MSGHSWGHVVFLSVNSYRKEIQMRSWSHRVHLVKTRRMIYMFTCFDPTWPWGHVTWGHLLTFTFRGQKIHFSMHLDERNTMAFELLFCLFHQKLLAKNDLFFVGHRLASEVTVWPWLLIKDIIGFLSSRPTRSSLSRIASSIRVRMAANSPICAMRLRGCD